VYEYFEVVWLTAPHDVIASRDVMLLQHPSSGQVNLLQLLLRYCPRKGGGGCSNHVHPPSSANLLFLQPSVKYCHAPGFYDATLSRKLHYALHRLSVHPSRAFTQNGKCRKFESVILVKPVWQIRDWNALINIYIFNTISTPTYWNIRFY